MADAAADGHIVAVAVADVLVDSGVAFRSAHHIVGALVRAADEAGVSLSELGNEAFATALGASDDEAATSLALDPGAAERLRGAATLEGALARCDVIGGTAPSRVASELAAAAERLGLAS